jgi:hypothetical protein
MASVGPYEIGGGSIYLAAANIDRQLLRRASLFDFRAGAVWQFRCQTKISITLPYSYPIAGEGHFVAWSPFTTGVFPNIFNFDLGFSHTATRQYVGAPWKLSYSATVFNQLVTNDSILADPNLPAATGTADWILTLTVDSKEAGPVGSSCEEDWIVTGEVNLNGSPVIKTTRELTTTIFELSQLCNGFVEIQQVSPAPFRGPDPFTPGTLWPNYYSMNGVEWSFQKPDA